MPRPTWDNLDAGKSKRDKIDSKGSILFVTLIILNQVLFHTHFKAFAVELVGWQALARAGVIIFHSPASSTLMFEQRKEPLILQSSLECEAFSSEPPFGCHIQLIEIITRQAF